MHLDQRFQKGRYERYIITRREIALPKFMTKIRFSPSLALKLRRRYSLAAFLHPARLSENGGNRNTEINT